MDLNMPIRKGPTNWQRKLVNLYLVLLYYTYASQGNIIIPDTSHI